jgi:hypothetical protein
LFAGPNLNAALLPRARRHGRTTANSKIKVEPQPGMKVQKKTTKKAKR